MRIDKKIHQEIDLYLKNSKDKLLALYAIKTLFEDILSDEYYPCIYSKKIDASKMAQFLTDETGEKHFIKSVKLEF